MPTADLTLGRGPDRDNAQRPAQRDPGGDGLGAHLFQFHVGSGGQCGARSVGAGREQLGDLALRGIKRFTYVYDMSGNWASRRSL